eukprot:TRINITY_DN5342_c0_g1_i4.p1 TRINITY_DN5342_c0_g1~~TRINITY_DN5342_c0_g1_i4.p1  ORF type:complete len:217 (+),score=53.74 TRINITY_DN5342_c0_g1_i4:333-983(+)
MCHYRVRATINGDPVTRYYTRVSILNESKYEAQDEHDERHGRVVELWIKHYPDGLLSNYIHHLTIGQAIELDGPIGGIAPEELSGTIVLIGGGTGVLPFLDVVDRQTDDPNIQTLNGHLILFASFATEKDIVARQWLEDRARKSKYFTLVITVQHVEDASNWSGPVGRFTDDMIRETVGHSAARFFVCGPARFTKSINQQLLALEYNSDSIQLLDG